MRIDFWVFYLEFSNLHVRAIYMSNLYTSFYATTFILVLYLLIISNNLCQCSTLTHILILFFKLFQSLLSSYPPYMILLCMKAIFLNQVFCIDLDHLAAEIFFAFLVSTSSILAVCLHLQSPEWFLILLKKQIP